MTKVVIPCPRTAMPAIYLLQSCFNILCLVLLADCSPQYCKPIPGSPKWPSPTAWQQLNNTIGGRLLAPTPPGAVCHPSSPTFDNATCASVFKSWTSSDWHAQNPITADYNDDTCLPDPRAPCSASGYPAYVAAAPLPQTFKLLSVLPKKQE